MKKNKTRYICDFEGCRHRNEENVCCLFNPDNCVYFRKVMDLKSENLALDRAYTELYKQYEEVKANADYQLEGRDLKIKELEKELADAKKVQVVEHFEAYGQCRDSRRIAELEVQNKELQCCANCNNSCGGEEEPYHDCGYCHAMQCICKLKLEEHTSDIYRMWEDKCERWEMRVN